MHRTFAHKFAFESRFLQNESCLHCDLMGRRRNSLLFRCLSKDDSLGLMVSIVDFYKKDAIGWKNRLKKDRRDTRVGECVYACVCLCMRVCRL